jgi:hypothetical protein
MECSMQICCAVKLAAYVRCKTPRCRSMYAFSDILIVEYANGCVPSLSRIISHGIIDLAMKPTGGILQSNYLGSPCINTCVNLS